MTLALAVSPALTGTAHLQPFSPHVVDKRYGLLYVGKPYGLNVAVNERRLETKPILT